MNSAHFMDEDRDAMLVNLEENAINFTIHNERSEGSEFCSFDLSKEDTIELIDLLRRFIQ